ncbi:MAG: RdgB/HAM1 family non-canonical purine NTP pyrophosphatase [Candidatus Kapabacteria bacterium]|nr:RdgB/HAM1 family non-canonical purine NTP pyrophosphatase [Candidatus Kapabacteria bacterium]
MTILLATNNAHKAAELSAILADGQQGITVLTLRDLPVAIPEPIEDGETLEANAYIKAAEVFQATGIPTIADDTGLEVQALDGAPGVYSARYAGPDATYADNCRKLIDALAGEENRRAQFRTVLCYTDGLRTLFAEGNVAGTILHEGRGDAGFGYDPIFLPEGEDQTFAQMNPTQKNSISHRGRALVALRATLAPIISQAELPPQPSPADA